MLDVLGFSSLSQTHHYILRLAQNPGPFGLPLGRTGMAGIGNLVSESLINK